MKTGFDYFLYIARVAPHVPISPAEAFIGSSEAGLYGDYVQQMDLCRREGAP